MTNRSSISTTSFQGMLQRPNKPFCQAIGGWVIWCREYVLDPVSFQEFLKLV